MNILHIALGTPEFDRAAIELGHSVYRVDWRKALFPNQSVLDALKGRQFDVIFAQIQTPGAIKLETWDALRASGALVINWSGDVREDIEWYVEAAAHVDITAFTNLTDVDSISAAGHRAEYLQIGYDETIYRQAIYRQAITDRKGVVFLGNNYRHRFPLSEAREDMVVRMQKEFGAEFQVFGMNWGTKSANAQEEVRIYQSALVAINFDHFNRPMFASDRIIRAQACGCAVVSMGYPGIRDEHPWVGAADSLDNMVEMIRLELDNPYYTVQVGKAAANHTFENHRWHNRIQQIEQWLS